MMEVLYRKVGELIINWEIACLLNGALGVVFHLKHQQQMIAKRKPHLQFAFSFVLINN